MVEDSQPAVTVEQSPSPEMVQIPLPPCWRCGRRQPVASIGIPEGAMIGEPSFKCSFCGAHNGGRGSFHAQRVGGDLQAIFYDADVHTLSRLRAALTSVSSKASEMDEDEVVAAVEAVSPQAASWLRNREDRRDLMTAIGLLIAAISVLIAWKTYTKAPEPASPQIEKLIIQVENGAISDPGLPRKAPCWCGSGKKYKNCHGVQDLAPPPAPTPPTP